MFVFSIVIYRNCTRPDIDTLTYRSIANITQMWYFCFITYIRLFNFDKVTNSYMISDIGFWTYMCIWTNCYIISYFTTVYSTLSNRSIISNYTIIYFTVWTYNCFRSDTAFPSND